MKEYTRPATLDETMTLHQQGGRFLAGGTRINRGVMRPDYPLIDLCLLGLDRIELSGTHTVIGAMVTLQAIIDSSAVPFRPLVKEAAAAVASRTLRGMATIGGEIAADAPDSVLVAALLAAQAELDIRDKTGMSRIALSEYLAQKPDALIVYVRLAHYDGGVRYFSRTSHSHNYLIAAVNCSGPYIILGDGVSAVRRQTAIEAAVRDSGRGDATVIEDIVKKLYQPEGDYHAGSEYKKYLAGIAVADLLVHHGNETGTQGGCQ